MCGYVYARHSGIAGIYQNLELLGDLFNYFDLKTLILCNFLSLAADIIFWVMRSMWKCAKKQISHLYTAWVANIFERWNSYISVMGEGGIFKFQNNVHGVVTSTPKILFPLFIYLSLQYFHKFIVKRKNIKYVAGRHIMKLGPLIEINLAGKIAYISILHD